MTFDAQDDYQYFILLKSLEEAKVAVQVLEHAPPPNNLCQDAVALLPNTTVVGTNVNSISFDTSKRGTWYFANGTGQSLTLSTCSEKTDYETELSVFRVDSYNNNCHAYTVDTTVPVARACINELGTSITLESEVGEVYYIRVSGVREEEGTFTLSLNDYDDYATSYYCPRFFPGCQ